ncbi:MAG: pyridoxamine 5'-phosphate oxidase family protein [Aquabacterium sp.]
MDADQSDLLRATLAHQEVAALATLHKGDPAVSMVPYALMPDGTGAIIHVSRLATHTADMQAHPAVSLLVMAPRTEGDDPLALPRVSLQGQARVCAKDDAVYAQARAAYLARFPQAEPMFGFGDFSLFLIDIRAVRFVAGFGRAHALTPEAFATLVATASAGASTSSPASSP